MVNKKTTSRKRAENLLVTVKKLLEKTPANKEQASEISKLAKSLTVFERLEVSVAKAQDKADAAKAKVKVAAEKFKAKKTPAAKRAVEKARITASSATSSLAAAKLKAREKSTEIKEGIAAVVQAEKKEIAKNKAVATFVARWETRYDRMSARKARKKAARQKAGLRKKRSVATAKTAVVDSTPIKAKTAVRGKISQTATAKVTAAKITRSKTPGAATKTRTSRAVKTRKKARAAR